jgi:hypothetical protein
MPGIAGSMVNFTAFNFTPVSSAAPRSVLADLAWRGTVLRICLTAVVFLPLS